MTWLTAMEYLCHKWPCICSTCRKHFPGLTSFMTYHQFVTRLTRQVPLVEQELLTLPGHLSLWVSCYLIFISLWKIVWSSIILLLPLFMCMFCRSFFFPFVLFLFAIVLSFLLWYTHSDYPFGIFKLFLFHFSYPSKIKLSFFMLNLYVFH